MTRALLQSCIIYRPMTTAIWGEMEFWILGAANLSALGWAAAWAMLGVVVQKHFPKLCFHCPINMCADMLYSHIYTCHHLTATGYQAATMTLALNLSFWPLSLHRVPMEKGHWHIANPLSDWQPSGQASHAFLIHHQQESLYEFISTHACTYCITYWGAQAGSHPSS